MSKSRSCGSMRRHHRHRNTTTSSSQRPSSSIQHLVPSKAHNPKSDTCRRTRLSYSKSAGQLRNHNKEKEELSAIMENDRSNDGGFGLQLSRDCDRHRSFEDFKKARRDGYKLRKRISAEFKTLKRQQRRKRSFSLDDSKPNSATCTVPGNADISFTESSTSSNARWIATTCETKLSSPLPSTLRRPNVRVDVHSHRTLMTKFDKWDCQGSPTKNVKSNINSNKKKSVSCDQLLKLPTRRKCRTACDSKSTKSNDANSNLRRLSSTSSLRHDEDAPHMRTRCSHTAPNHKIKSLRAALGPLTPGMTTSLPPFN